PPAVPWLVLRQKPCQSLLRRPSQRARSAHKKHGLGSSIHVRFHVSAIRGSGTCGGSFSQAPRVPGAKGRRRRPPTRRPALDPAPRALLAADMRSPFFPSDAQQKEPLDLAIRKVQAQRISYPLLCSEPRCVLQENSERSTVFA